MERERYSSKKETRDICCRNRIGLVNLCYSNVMLMFKVTVVFSPFARYSA